MRTFLDPLYQGCRLAWRATGLAAILLFAFRVAFLIRYAGPQTHLGEQAVARALLMGARFDLKVAAVVAIPLIVLGALWAAERGRWAAPAWAGLSLFALAIAAMVNDGYFGYYHTPIDGIVFGVFEDDTAAVFRSLWEDHHLLLGFVVALLLAACHSWLVVRPPRRAPAPSIRVALLAATPLLLLLAIRGRVGSFPLNAKDFSVSTEPLLNASVPNGPIALSVAVSERLDVVAIGDDPEVALRKAGFKSPARAAAALGIAPTGASDAEVAEALFTRSRKNPAAAEHPPHVVLVVMESWGADLLRYHSARTDLLGRLAPHLTRGLLFRRFVSGQNGTDGSLEALLVNTPLTPLLSGPDGHTRFEQASVLPFKAAGYRTVFGMGWSGRWRGIARSYPNQGFDEVGDVNDVLSVVPDAPVGTWGVPDEALFRWALHRLEEADAKGERLLLVLMTATNHSPLRIPPGYQVRPIDLASFAGRAIGERSMLLQLQTYQYACDALGGFLDGIEERGLSGRTVVAATGDHNTREFFKYPDARDLPWRDRVPFFLQAPPAYLGEASPDLDRWAGHRDIFPTLAGLALSEARVFRAGEDLLAPAARTPRALARFEAVLSDRGVVPVLGEAPVLCSGDDGELSADPAGSCGPELKTIAREERAYAALLDWEVRRQAIRAAAATRPPTAGAARQP
jgi:phosphoglycerol transferase MdoB-like AlkP superfamily enzyme